MHIAFRWAEGRYDRLPALVASLVDIRVAVIAAAGGQAVSLAAKAATSTIPIVFVSGEDPVKLGLVASLNRPGGNATGVSMFLSEMEAKRLALLHELVPTATMIGVIVNPSHPSIDTQLREINSAARALGRQIQIVNANNERELDAAFASLAQSKAGALLIASNAYFTSRRDQIVALAAQRALPAIYDQREFAMAGGLVSYGTNLSRFLSPHGGVHRQNSQRGKASRFAGAAVDQIRARDQSQDREGARLERAADKLLAPRRRGDRLM